MICPARHPVLDVGCELRAGAHAEHWARHEGTDLNWPNEDYLAPIERPRDQARAMAERAEHAYLPANPRPTQVRAAERVLPKTGSQRRKVYDTIARNVHGATDDEVATYLRIGLNSVRPRRLELVEAGLVEDSGICRKTPSGHDAIVWRAIPLPIGLTS